jgi:uncharacterized protein YdaU (DUF1376 family)
MKLYWGDYFRDTRRLNRLEHSAYLLLLGEMWIKGGKLSTDDATLASITLCTAEEWDEVKVAVLPFFKVVRGKLTQKRLAFEMAKYDDTKRKRKVAGKKGGEASRGNDRENTEANGQHLPTKPEPEPEPEPEKKEKGTRASKRCPSGWMPDDSVMAAGKDAGLTEPEVQRQLMVFRDHEFPRALTDWQAAARNWVRRSGSHKKPEPKRVTWV